MLKCSIVASPNINYNYTDSLQHLFPYLWLVKAHVVSHDVELSYMGTPVPFDPLGYEGEWIAKLVAHWKGETQAMLLTKAVKHVENGAAGCLVGLQKHDVCLGPAGAQRRPLTILRK